jgi:hypothetical protein
MYARALVGVGYFWLASQQAAYPRYRARWAHLAHAQVAEQAAAEQFAYDLGQFVLWGATHMVQLDFIRIGVVSTLDTTNNASNQGWDWSTLYDHGGQVYPSLDASAWYWGKYDTTEYGADYPVPPYHALRYRRVTAAGIPGREHYGYCRTVKYRYSNFGGGGVSLSYPYPPIYEAQAYAWHVDRALTGSGYGASYHSSAGSKREIVLYYRQGVGLNSESVVGYELAGTTTTSRTFRLYP